MVEKILFLCWINIKVHFLKLVHFKKIHILIKIVLISRKIQLVDNKKFTIIAQNSKKKHI